MMLYLDPTHKSTLTDLIKRYTRNYDHLVQDVETILDTLAAKEAEVQTREGRWYLMHILAYRPLENVIEGAVLTFVDVSAQKQAQEKLQQLSAATQEAL